MDTSLGERDRMNKPVSETVETTATYELEKLDKRILGDTSFDGHKLT